MKKKPTAYTYKNPRISIVRDSIGARLDRRNQTPEVFTGTINGVKASDLEERYARSLNKYGLPYSFRERITSALQGKQYLTSQFLNMTGEVEIDFLVERGGITPIFIDGEIGHFYTAYQAEHDAIKTNAADEYGKSQGWRPSVRVPFWVLTTQESTDRTVREMFSNEWVATSKSMFWQDAGPITNDGSGYNWNTPGKVIELTTNTRVMRQTKYTENGGLFL